MKIPDKETEEKFLNKLANLNRYLLSCIEDAETYRFKGKTLEATKEVIDLNDLYNKAWKLTQALGSQCGEWGNDPAPEQFESPEAYAKWKKEWDEGPPDSRDERSKRPLSTI